MPLGHWGTDNPHIICQTPLQDQEVGKWHAVNVKRTTEPISFYDTLIQNGI
jgi:hypothetical protein